MNKKFLAQMNALAASKRNDVRAELAKEMTPQFFAAMVLGLSRMYEFDTDDLVEIMENVGEIWNNNSAKDIVRMCAEETNIRITQEAEN